MIQRQILVVSPLISVSLRKCLLSPFWGTKNRQVCGSHGLCSSRDSSGLELLIPSVKTKNEGQGVLTGMLLQAT